MPGSSRIYGSTNLLQSTRLTGDAVSTDFAVFYYKYSEYYSLFWNALSV
jgi:hypothetical protein